MISYDFVDRFLLLLTDHSSMTIGFSAALSEITVGDRFLMNLF